MVVLERERVSVTCEVSPGGRVRWWLTKESGQLPAKCGDRTCWTCGTFAEGTELEVRAYVAVKVEARVAVFRGRNDTVFFAPLQASVLDEVQRQLLPCLLEAGAREDEGDCERSTVLHWELQSALERGVFCGSVGPGNRFSRWLQYSGFTGVFPDGKDGFFTGITDAVGVVGSSHGRWLRCSEY